MAYFSRARTQPKENTMKKINKMIVGVFCALLLATSAFAASTAVNASTNAPVVVTTVAVDVPTDAWVLTLGGSGGTTTKGDSQSVFGVDLSVGRSIMLSDKSYLNNVEVGVRQGISYASQNNGNVLLSTKAYADLTLFTYKTVDLFAGANVGLIYGDTEATWIVAPEAGLRWWMKKDVAIVGRLEYPYTDRSGGFSEVNALTYFLGLQIKF